MAEENKTLKDAQYRKGLGISWFNSNNGAVEMVKLDHALGLFKSEIVPLYRGKPMKGYKKKKIPTLEERLDFWQDRMLEKYNDFYSKVIATVGVNYNVEDSINKLYGVNTIAELKQVWMSYSEDERHDPKIKEVVKKLKEKFQNEKA